MSETVLATGVIIGVDTHKLTHAAVAIDTLGARLGTMARAVQRCWVDRIESTPPHLRCEASRLIARGIPEPANV